VPLTDLPLSALREYRPELVPPPDLAERWAKTLAEARAHDVDVRLEPVDVGLRQVEVSDVTFAGFAGDPVRAWLHRPAGVEGPLPVVVEYNGYGGGRGLPHERLLWATAGYASLFMDTRGQGSGWGSGGHTADPAGSAGEGAPAHPGFMTRGVRDFDTYYYRRLITDAVRAVDAVRTLDGIDHDRIVVTGVSQGGGLALAVAGLVDGLAAVMPDVPFLCHIRRGVEIAADPYGEVERYLAVHRDAEDEVFRTLSYVDGAHLGARASAPALFSVALMDPICPPSTVFAALHAYGGPVDVEVYPYNGHEGGQGHHQLRQLAWLRRTLP
jgi:cephalosporin-C deacetylase